MDVQHSTIMPETMGLAVEVVRHQTGEQFEGLRAARNGDQSFWNVGVSSAFASFSRHQKHCRRMEKWDLTEEWLL